MRVNLSYSVDIGQVLAEVSNLFAREKERLIVADQLAMETLKNKISDEDVEKVLVALDGYKKALANFDIRLTEMQMILQGYHGIINAPPEEASQELGLEANSELLTPSDATLDNTNLQ